MKNIVSNVDQLRRAIDCENKMTQVSFARSYYLDVVNPKACEDELNKHYDRLKSLFKGTGRQAPERIASYCNYFNIKYRNQSKDNEADCNAVYEMYVELDSRIATQPLKNGSDDSALKSLSILFSRFREISCKYGKSANNFHYITSNVLNNELRPFTSKWHNKLDSCKINQDFRNELGLIQTTLGKFKAHLREVMC